MLKFCSSSKFQLLTNQCGIWNDGNLPAICSGADNHQGSNFAVKWKCWSMSNIQMNIITITTQKTNCIQMTKSVISYWYVRHALLHQQSRHLYHGCYSEEVKFNFEFQIEIIVMETFSLSKTNENKKKIKYFLYYTELRWIKIYSYIIYKHITVLCTTF